MNYTFVVHDFLEMKKRFYIFLDYNPKKSILNNQGERKITKR